MRMHLIYPRWRKLERQTTFHLPPHGPVVFAATVPERVELSFTDDNIDEVDFDKPTDLVGLSVMLTSQLPRAFEIADRFRAQGTKVIMGGISVMLHAAECAQHADSIFLGETEGYFEGVIADFERGQLGPRYDYMAALPDVGLVGPARRSVLNREAYNYRGVQMLDLVHASRGCRFNCFPCSAAFLGGRAFRPRPVAKAIAEMEAIPNNRLFIVDNSLAQEKAWLKQLLLAMEPLKKTWVSHPLLDDDEILRLAAKAGCWYTYQAIVDTSDHIRTRVKRLQDHGIGVEGTIILGSDDQTEDDIKRLVEFLHEIRLDMAEFTILTPFVHSPIRVRMEKDGRILHDDWKDYTTDRVVFRPKHMTPERLQALYYWAWDSFYKDAGHAVKMGQLFMQAVKKERANGTWRRFDTRNRQGFVPLTPGLG